MTMALVVQHQSEEVVAQCDEIQVQVEHHLNEIMSRPLPRVIFHDIKVVVLVQCDEKIIVEVIHLKNEIVFPLLLFHEIKAVVRFDE